MEGGPGGWHHLQWSTWHSGLGQGQWMVLPSYHVICPGRQNPIKWVPPSLGVHELSGLQTIPQANPEPKKLPKLNWFKWHLGGIRCFPDMPSATWMSPNAHVPPPISLGASSQYACVIRKWWKHVGEMLAFTARWFRCASGSTWCHPEVEWWMGKDQHPNLKKKKLINSQGRHCSVQCQFLQTWPLGEKWSNSQTKTAFSV